MPSSNPLKQIVLEALGTEPGVEIAILFGSTAMGAERRESDLDLAVDAGHVLTAEEKFGLISKLAGRIGRPVDLVDLRTAGEPLHRGKIGHKKIPCVCRRGFLSLN